PVGASGAGNLSRRDDRGGKGAPGGCRCRRGRGRGRGGGGRSRRRRGECGRGRIMKNLGQLMKQAQAMQAKMAEMQAQLETVEMTGLAGGGMVRLVLNGKGDVKKLTIDKAAVDPAEVEVLEDLIVAAFN